MGVSVGKIVMTAEVQERRVERMGQGKREGRSDTSGTEPESKATN